MRRLGESLGSRRCPSTATLRASRDLLDGMLDLVLAAIGSCRTLGGDWREAIRTRRALGDDALRLHGWRGLLMTGSHMRPGRLHYMERLLARSVTAVRRRDDLSRLSPARRDIFGFTLGDRLHDDRGRLGGHRR